MFAAPAPKSSGFGISFPRSNLGVLVKVHFEPQPQRVGFSTFFPKRMALRLPLSSKMYDRDILAEMNHAEDYFKPLLSVFILVSNPGGCPGVNKT